MPFTVKSKMEVGDSGAGSGTAGASLAKRAASAASSPDMVASGRNRVVRVTTNRTHGRKRAAMFVVGVGVRAHRYVLTFRVLLRPAASTTYLLNTRR